MTLRTGLAFISAISAGAALGLWAGPRISWPSDSKPQTVIEAPAATANDAARPTPTVAGAPARVDRPGGAVELVAYVSVPSDLIAHEQPLLQPGTNMSRQRRDSTTRANFLPPSPVRRTTSASRSCS